MSTKLLIGNIDSAATEEGIREFLMPIMSQVVSVDVPMDARSGRNRGYAYVILRTAMQAENAVRDLHGKSSLGRNVTVTIVEQAPVKGKWYKFGAK